jgi:hypothetical protein
MQREFSTFHFIAFHSNMDKKYFFLKLNPPRASFTVDMTDDERAIMHAHIAYWEPHVRLGTIFAMGVVPPPDTCFYAMGPYSNPSEPLSDDVSILVHYCASTSAITAQVYSMMGVPIGSPTIYVSDGQIWDRLPINAPSVSGTYYITVTVGSFSATLGYVVY